MPRMSAHVVTLIGSAALAACAASPAKPLAEPLTVRVTSADSSRPARFTMDVTGGQAAFATPELRGQAGQPRLTASTPAELVLRPGTTAAAFRGLDGAQLTVIAVSAHARLMANGTRVRVASTEAGLSIRDY